MAHVALRSGFTRRGVVLQAEALIVKERLDVPGVARRRGSGLDVDMAGAAIRHSKLRSEILIHIVALDAIEHLG